MPAPGRELRRHRRRRISTDATIHFADGVRLNCKVIDISEAGALILLRDEIDMPFDFRLEIGGGGVVRRTCYVVRQDGRKVGVRFPHRV